MTERSFLPKMIPPGIHDERSVAMLGLFAAMAEEFDFSNLLMRNSSEMPDEALELAVHDYSLTEFIGADGVPAKLAGKFVDGAWNLHEKQGTDEGVILGQNLLGIGAEITHWWQKTPRGHHNTHTVTLNLGDVDEPPVEPLSLEVQQTAAKTVEATKRYSQDTELVWRTRARMDLFVNCHAQDLQKVKILPPLVREVSSSMSLTMAASANVGEVIRIKPKPVAEISVATPMSFGASVSSGEVVRIYTYQPDVIESPSDLSAPVVIQSASTTTTIMPEGSA